MVGKLSAQIVNSLNCRFLTFLNLTGEYLNDYPIPALKGFTTNF